MLTATHAFRRDLLLLQGEVVVVVVEVVSARKFSLGRRGPTIAP